MDGIKDKEKEYKKIYNDAIRIVGILNDEQLDVLKEKAIKNTNEWAYDDKLNKEYKNFYDKMNTEYNKMISLDEYKKNNYNKVNKK